MNKEVFNGEDLLKPISGEFAAGDFRIDIYAVASIIILMFITKEVYYTFDDQHHLKSDARKHLHDKNASSTIKELIKTFLINDDATLWYDLEQLEK
jgi:hypothetical protein